MRVTPLVAAAALTLAIPSIASAQTADAPTSEVALAEMSEKLADPEFQAQASQVGLVLMQGLLDLEIGPLAEAMERATGGEGPDIAPDARVRDLSPDAEALPEAMAEKLPEAMSAMSVMSEGLAAMMPGLRDMAERLRKSMEEAGDGDSEEAAEGAE